MKVEVKKYTDVYVRPDLIRWFEESRSKENITCHYYSRIHNVEMGESDANKIMGLQRFFPHKWLMKQGK